MAAASTRRHAVVLLRAKHGLVVAVSSEGSAGDAAAGNGRAAPLDEAAARELSAARRRQVKDILGVESAESWWADRSQSELGRVTKPPVS